MIKDKLFSDVNKQLKNGKFPNSQHTQKKQQFASLQKITTK